MAQKCMDMGGQIPSKEEVQEVLDDLVDDENNTISVGKFKDFIKDILKGLIK